MAARGPVADICANLKRLQEHSGVSIQKLAKQIGYSRSHLYKIRNGEIVEPPGEALAEAWIRACTPTDTAADAALQEFRELAAEYRNQRRRAQEQISGPPPAATPQPATGKNDISPPVAVDVFVSYTGADEAWATWVAAVLEAEGQTVRVQAWDSPAGTNFVGWINEQMTLAARTVAICSRAYFASHWCTQEWTGALADNTLTPLRVQDCTLPKVLATVAYRDLYDIDETTARRRLLEAAGLACPDRRPGGFPGRPVDAEFPANPSFVVPAASGPVSSRQRSNPPHDGRVPVLSDRTADWGAAASPLVDGVPVEIVAAVQRAYTDLVENAGDGIIDLPGPIRWTRLELRVLRDAADACVSAEQPPLRRRADKLVALCDTAIASPVLAEIGIDRIRLERLQCIYREAVDRWPDGGSAAAMAAEAAHAAIVERRGTRGIDLTSLARFVLGLAAHRGVGMNAPALAEWVRVTGHQVADAEAYLASLADRAAWLLIDLDDEPMRDGDPLWPRTLTSQLCTSDWDKDGKDLPIVDREVCESAEDLEHALRRLLNRVNLPTTVFVDIVAPRALLDSGIENLMIMQVDDDEYEPLTAGYRPRLRWSKRRTSRRLYERLQRRTAAAAWRNDVAVFPHGRGAEKGQILDWLRQHSHHPVVLGSAGHGTVDPLRIMLMEGCGFVLWFPAGLDSETTSEVNAVAGRVPVAARKVAIPDEIAAVSVRPMILWDDPNGREDVRLPPIVRLQSPDS